MRAGSESISKPISGLPTKPTCVFTIYQLALPGAEGLLLFPKYNIPTMAGFTLLMRYHCTPWGEMHTIDARVPVKDGCCSPLFTPSNQTSLDIQLVICWIFTRSFPRAIQCTNGVLKKQDIQGLSSELKINLVKGMLGVHYNTIRHDRNAEVRKAT